MNSLRKSWERFFPGLCCLFVAGLLVGCGSLGEHTTNPPPSTVTGTTSDVLSAGDLITIVFSDTPTATTPFEERVKDDGTITLLYNQTFKVAGKSRSTVEKEIRDRYVPSYYVNLTVSVKPMERFYYVNGEVKTPSRQPYPGETTVLKAIASAQGFTDFANKKKVRLTRANGRTIIVNCEKALEDAALDLPVYPGDKINVPRSLW